MCSQEGLSKARKPSTDSSLSDGEENKESERTDDTRDHGSVRLSTEKDSTRE